MQALYCCLEVLSIIMILFTVKLFDCFKENVESFASECAFSLPRLIEIGTKSFPEIFHKKGMVQEVCRLTLLFFSHVLFV